MQKVAVPFRAIRLDSKGEAEGLHQLEVGGSADEAGEHVVEGRDQFPVALAKAEGAVAACALSVDDRVGKRLRALDALSDERVGWRGKWQTLLRTWKDV